MEALQVWVPISRSRWWWRRWEARFSSYLKDEDNRPTGGLDVRCKEKETSQG